ncbi:hypothetical protein C8J55DRAFT_558171 [Lentinula edodes]|uniref:Uncharacterized protein n=1 Tax=Lentinula lateritia TaxID=40482 RepID=A0A9W9ARH3_9AGAR|nr:hypothetical protein C8J55DRAFT_558171 [Lentinula edodes]
MSAAHLQGSNQFDAASFSFQIFHDLCFWNTYKTSWVIEDLARSSRHRLNCFSLPVRVAIISKSLSFLATDLPSVEGVGSKSSVTETATGTTLRHSAASSQASTSSILAASASGSSLVSSMHLPLLPTTSTSFSVSSSALSSSASSSSSSSVSSSTSATSPITTATSTSSIPQVTQLPTATEDIEPIFSVILGVLFTLTESAAPSSTASSSSSVLGDILSSDGKKAGITAVIVIASCAGGAATPRTIFPKWKLGRSLKFDQCLQPINWQPTTGDGIDSGISIRRRRVSDTSSFHSGVYSGPDMGHCSSENGFTTPPIPRLLYDLCI